MRFLPLSFLFLLVISFAGCDLFDMEPDSITDNSPPIEWSFTVDDINRNEPGSIVQTSDGNFVVAGHVNRDVGYNYAELFMIKFNSDGQKIWQRDYEGIDLFSDDIQMIGCENGDILVSGSYLTDTTGNSFRLQRFDSEGNLLWHNRYFDNDPNQHIHDMVATSDGSSLLLSHTMQGSNALVIKVNSDGSQAWSYHYPSDGSRSASCAVEDNNGNYRIIAEANVSSSSTYSEFFSFTLSPEGTLLDTAKFVFDSHLVPVACVLSQSGNVFLAVHNTRTFLIDSYLLEIDDNNQIINEYCYGGLGIDVISDIKRNQSVEMVCVGYTSSLGGSGENIWILKLAPDGSPVWQKAIGKDYDDYGRGAVITDDGDIYITGKLRTDFNAFKTYIARIAGN